MAQLLRFNVKVNETLNLFLRREILEQFKSQSTQAISNSKIRRLIFAGAVSINDRQVRDPSFEVRKGSTVSVLFDEKKFFFEKQNDDVAFEVTNESVLFEDEYLIVVNKPCHFPTEATIVTSRDNMHDAVVRYLHAKNPSLRNPPYVGIMHRLDRETSGVLLFTKQRSVNNKIHDMFDSSDVEESVKNGRHYERPVTKTYIAGVAFSNKVKDKSFSVKNYIGRVTGKSQAGKWGELPQSKGGQFAFTEFEKIDERELLDLGITKSDFKNSEGQTTYIFAHPITGRTHQIRVHLSSLGLPIIGDELYGGKKEKRMLLHALSLEFNHPVTGERLLIKAPL
jgi:23S rRNA pseudouridine1911/1915/1917 synthase